MCVWWKWGVANEGVKSVPIFSEQIRTLNFRFEFDFAKATAFFDPQMTFFVVNDVSNHLVKNRAWLDWPMLEMLNNPDQWILTVMEVKTLIQIADSKLISDFNFGLRL